MSRSPLRSMTGFARVRRPLSDGELIVSLKSLNHRGLDIHVHAPSAADTCENSIRAMVKSQMVRGHVGVRIALPSSTGQSKAPALNQAFLEAYLKIFREAAALHGISSGPDLNAALRVPGMFEEAFRSHRFRIPRSPSCLICQDAGTPQDLDQALDDALARLNQ